ncbi:hypothetical protein [Paraburkholderia adhaesiva]|uniref:hypothetical protein n=1 Tax=Paraburkholderia adhaesiva TaxID=2883244 RepID=UPI001F428EC5|nr:hypothetical protein [Paraburkholderia adhaesiva]
MKYVKIAVLACSLFAAAAAQAQNEVPAASAPPQGTQTAASQAVATPSQGEISKPARKDDCVGPAGFCINYFGS